MTASVLYVSEALLYYNALFTLFAQLYFSPLTISYKIFLLSGWKRCYTATEKKMPFSVGTQPIALYIVLL